MRVKIFPWVSSTVLGAVAIAITFLPVESTDADQVPGYVPSASGTIIRTGSGACLHSGSWAEEMVVEECDPELYAKLHPPVVEVAAVEIITITDTLDSEALFDFDKDTLTPKAEEVLNTLSLKLDGYKNVSSVKITGHTDRIGPMEYNMGLSERRAATVENWLRENTHVIPDAAFTSAGVGPESPLVACEGESGSALIDCLQPNRRVTVETLAEREEERAVEEIKTN